MMHDSFTVGVYFHFRFPFQDRELSSDHSSPPVVVEATESGLCHGVVMWWSIDLEGEELSMSPWDYRQVTLTTVT